FAPASFLIHFSSRSSGWSEADCGDSSPSASRCLLLACGIGVFDRYRIYRRPDESQDPASFRAPLNQISRILTALPQLDFT
ncbi:hypothetical protein, partial [Herbaspirillum sp.]|uniref:hypothetical protein n=1 Tax=Herbaspirillum sp. TaxID=1890675 RepID=UPI001B18E884